MAAPSAPRLLVGLGNPGAAYAGTRHNVGFEAVDRVAAELRLAFRPEKKWRCEWAAGSGLWLLKPLTYMNLSGESAAALWSFYKIDPSETLVILDDTALPMGRLRLRATGSAGGHNGLQSILDHAGTADVPRLRIGIGPAGEGADLVGHVLGRFASSEREAADAAVRSAAEAALHAARNGLATAMNLYNQSNP